MFPSRLTSNLNLKQKKNCKAWMMEAILDLVEADGEGYDTRTRLQTDRGGRRRTSNSSGGWVGFLGSLLRCGDILAEGLELGVGRPCRRRRQRPARMTNHPWVRGGGQRRGGEAAAATLSH